jgi:serine/threonine protein kinase
VAIKRMPHVNPKDMKRNLNEIGALYSLRHPNVVEYIGAQVQKDEVWVRCSSNSCDVVTVAFLNGVAKCSYTALDNSFFLG